MDLGLELGRIDIYLLDQVLRGRVAPGARILDAGCGRGRNLHYFLKQGHPVCGVDEDPAAVETVQRMVASLQPDADASSIQVATIDALPFPDASFDLVICNAVLHFARDDEHFRGMADSLSRVLAPGGICFTRVASTIGIEDAVRPVGEGKASRWYALPDGSDRYLVDLEFLLGESARLGVELADPIKTVNVQGLRCMTNWVWRKPA